LYLIANKAISRFTKHKQPLCENEAIPVESFEETVN